MGGSFWQKESLITHILFELCLFRNLDQCTFFLLALYIRSNSFLFTEGKCRKISSIFLLVDSITAKPYIPLKSWFQLICSKFFMLWHRNDYFWPTWLWRLVKAKNVYSERTLWHFESTFGSSHSASSAYLEVLKFCFSFFPIFLFCMLKGVEHWLFYIWKVWNNRGQKWK